MSNDRDQIIKDTVAENAENPATQILESVNKKLAEGGHPEIRVIKEIDHQTRINVNCSNPGNLEGRTQYQVDHGDGTTSPPWWSDWACL